MVHSHNKLNNYVSDGRGLWSFRVNILGVVGFGIHACFNLLQRHADANVYLLSICQVTVADFPMYELLDQHRLMIPGVLDAYPKLTAFMNAFESLPKIKEYMASDKFMKRPINNKVAAFK